MASELDESYTNFNNEFKQVMQQFDAIDTGIDEHFEVLIDILNIRRSELKTQVQNSRKKVADLGSEHTQAYEDYSQLIEKMASLKTVNKEVEKAMLNEMFNHLGKMMNELNDQMRIQYIPKKYSDGTICNLAGKIATVDNNNMQSEEEAKQGAEGGISTKKMLAEDTLSWKNLFKKDSSRPKFELVNKHHQKQAVEFDNLTFLMRPLRGRELSLQYQLLASNSTKITFLSTGSSSTGSIDHIKIGHEIYGLTGNVSTGTLYLLIQGQDGGWYLQAYTNIFKKPQNHTEQEIADIPEFKTDKPWYQIAVNNRKICICWWNGLMIADLIWPPSGERSLINTTDIVQCDYDIKAIAIDENDIVFALKKDPCTISMVSSGSGELVDLLSLDLAKDLGWKMCHGWDVVVMDSNNLIATVSSGDFSGALVKIGYNLSGFIGKPFVLNVTDESYAHTLAVNNHGELAAQYLQGKETHLEVFKISKE